MNSKYTLQDYQLCLTVKSDNIINLTAEFLPTSELFKKESIQLMRIKKDTVIAIFERKSEKNFKCQFSQVFLENTKHLVVKFIVSLDFLPEFSEQVELEYIDKKESIKDVQLQNFRTDIQQIEQIVGNYEKNGVWNFQQINGIAGNNNDFTQLKRINLNKGKYLLRLSGIYTCSVAQMGSFGRITFQISFQGKQDKIKIVCPVYGISGYSYPWAFQEVIESCNGQLMIQVIGTFQTWTLANSQMTICPVSSK